MFKILKVTCDVHVTCIPLTVVLLVKLSISVLTIYIAQPPIMTLIKDLVVLIIIRDIMAQGLTVLIEYSYQQDASSFPEAHISKEPPS
jgi:hypothetical protein